MQEYVSAVNALKSVLHDGRAMDGVFTGDDSPLARQISFGVVRHFFSLSLIVSQLVKKPLTGKNADLELLLLAGIYSVSHLNRPAHASVNALVNATAPLKFGWAKGLVNGVLRNYLRNKQALDNSVSDDTQARWDHPGWLIKHIQHDWQSRADSIFAANNARAPMTLRVNQLKTNRARYLQLLERAGIEARPGDMADSAIYLASPVAVTSLPCFAEGWVSVQDEASQLAAGLVAAEPGMRVLDACAAPGGKTCHLLERWPGIALTALDIDPARLDIVRDNLQRLGLSAQCEATDLATRQGEAEYDRILLDAPCSATGIIRRHPDIKLLRRNSDIDKLTATQLSLLAAAWQRLKPGGQLVYSTCSILRLENERVMNQFSVATADCTVLPIDAEWGQSTGIGRQLLPDPQSHDGFYFATLSKQPTS